MVGVGWLLRSRRAVVLIVAQHLAGIAIDQAARNTSTHQQKQNTKETKLCSHDGGSSFLFGEAWDSLRGLAFCFGEE